MNGPYLIEGLDCSGKKSVAAEVVKRLRILGVVCDTVIGPFVQGPLGWLDHRLTASAGSSSPLLPILRLVKRLVYAAGPVVDGVAYRAPVGTLVVKVSSHFRAWARAELDRDTIMLAAFTKTRRWHIHFSGGTLLRTQFHIRLARHEQDAASGRVKKSAAYRFLDQTGVAFDEWHTILRRLMREHVPDTLELESSVLSPEAIAERVAGHILTLHKIRRTSGSTPSET